MVYSPINFSRRPESPYTLTNPHLEELTITAKLGNTELIITNDYIHTPSKLFAQEDTIHLWVIRWRRRTPSYWETSMLTTHRGIQFYRLESMVSGSNFGILNWDSPTRLPDNANPSSPKISLASASLITSTNWQTTTNLGSDHQPILISLQMDVTINPIQHRSSINLKKESWDRHSRETEDKLSKRRLPTHCQKGEKILRAIILKAASHHIHHLDDTESTQSRFQQRYWKRWEHEMISDP